MKVMRAEPGTCPSCDLYWWGIETVWGDGTVRTPGPDWKRDSMLPSHSASSRCESGGRNHCTCDTCF